VLSSEHGTNKVPPRYAPLFDGQDDVLASHRGWDIGSAELARALAKATGAPLHRARVSRLLIDCNRSPHHRRLFSEFTQALPPAEKARLLEQFYLPYRESVTAEVQRHVDGGQSVLHVSVHSFTRALDGKRRNGDIGLLYDPSRPAELDLCRRWRSLLAADPEFRVRRNYPYRGVADGLVKALRKRFPDPAYAAVELEVCQDLAEAGGARWKRLLQSLGATLGELV